MVIDAHRHFWHYTDSEFGWIDNDAIRRDFLDRSDAALFPYLEAALEAFGPGRVMFGSDWPVVTAHMPYSEWRAAVMRFLAPLSASEREAVMGGNAEGFYLNARQR